MEIPSKSITVLQTVRDESEISTQCYTAPGGVLDYPYALPAKAWYRLQAEKAAEQIDEGEQEERPRGSDASGNCVCPSKIGAEA